MAALEAMAYGLPCLLSTACNLPESFSAKAACRVVRPVVQPDANPTWKRHRIAPLPFAFEATAKDLDNDGDMDVVATAWTNTQRLYGQPVTDPDGARVVWFENRGDDPWVIHNLQEKLPDQ